jgi:hypothetical protein
MPACASRARRQESGCGGKTFSIGDLVGAFVFVNPPLLLQQALPHDVDTILSAVH